ncbi:MAG: translation initiation factor IF-3 [Simkaniaceae bacterium]|nr:translation initiation factor IF-3 [Simkaniaceae bacterium]
MGCWLLRTNRDIRAPQVRLIGSDGTQIGVVSLREAMAHAEQSGLDLVEISPNAVPPVCKVIDYGKYRYRATKRERESRKANQDRLKEMKFKPNIDDHDLMTKLKHVREWLEKGSKVRVTCMFRGRERAYPEHGMRVLQRVTEELRELSRVEAPPKQAGRLLSMVIAPHGKK